MLGQYGPYSMSREASGTSWQPDATPHQTVEWGRGDWRYMLDGFANLAYTNQGGPRGNGSGLTTNMVMLSGTRQFEQSAVGFRTMVSLEPLMGAKGYPELLQTGETADGVTPLIDRQHPHDLIDEMALTGNLQLGNEGSLFAYAGYPGEPALGPAVFLHRVSGQDNPLAPISHHWLDSTHVSYGVLTAGTVLGNVKVEGSAFRGREPDQYRWDVEEPKLDSFSGRISVNPTPGWSGQISYGHIKSSEPLYPASNTNRATASVGFSRAWPGGWNATTLAWGRNWQRGIDTLDAALLESEVNLRHVHTIFTRFEYVQKDDLVPAVTLGSALSFLRTPDYHPFFPQGQSGPLVLNIFAVKEFTLGYIYDFAQARLATWGVGGSGTISLLPSALDPYYGKLPLSYTLFIRLKLGVPEPQSPYRAAPPENI